MILMTLAAGSLALSLRASAAGPQKVGPLRPLAASVSAGHPAAARLCPLDDHVFAFGDARAVVHYTHESDAEGADVVRVVTTIVATEGAGAPGRFVSYLSPAQEMEVPVGGAVGTDPARLEFVFDGDFLSVRSVPLQRLAHLGTERPIVSSRASN